MTTGVAARPGARPVALLGGVGAAAALIVAVMAAALLVQSPPLQVWWLAMAAASLCLAAGAPRPWRGAGMVAATFLLGTSSQLALTQPLWYEFVQLRPTSSFSYLLYAAIAAQAGLAVAFFCRSGRIAAVLSGARRLGAGRLFLFLLLSLASTLGLMGYLARGELFEFGKELASRLVLLAVDGLSLLAFVAACPPGPLRSLSARMAARVSLGSEAEPRPLDRATPWIAAAFVLAVTATLSLLAFGGMPRIPDEVACLFQARSFAEGRIFVPPPPPGAAEALQYDWISMYAGRWFSIFPPGWPAALAVGVKLGAPWLVNPLLAALSMLAGHALATRLHSRGLANLTTALLAVSPWWLATAASLGSHPLTLALTLTAWLLLADDRRGSAVRWFAAGALMGWLFLVRPLDGLAVGGLSGLWALARIDRRRWEGWLAVAAYGLGCVLVGALVFPYNHALVGDPLLTPIDQYFNLLWGPGSNRLGFGADIGPPSLWSGLDVWRGHSPLEALVNSQFNLADLNRELFGWTIGSLGLVFVHLVWGRRNAFDLCMWAVIAAVAAAYGLYWYNGAFYIGPRYWFMMLWPLAYLSARGAWTLVARLAPFAPLAGPRVAAALALLALVSLVSFLSWRGVTKYRDFRDFSSDYRAIAAAPRLKGALVFVKAANLGDFGSAFALNDPGLPPDRPLFVNDRGPEANAAVRAAYPSRPAYFVEGRTASGQPHARLVPAAADTGARP